MAEDNESLIKLSDFKDAAKTMVGAIADSEFRRDVVRQARKLTLLPETSPYGVGAIPPEDALAKMSWADLLALRRKLKSTADQNAIAPFEHRAYARESSGTTLSAIQNIVATPMYLPIGGSRSDPSLREIGQGLVGAWEGLTK
jgi:hypothetical protein